MWPGMGPFKQLYNVLTSTITACPQQDCFDCSTSTCVLSALLLVFARNFLSAEVKNGKMWTGGLKFQHGEPCICFCYVVTKLEKGAELVGA